MLQCLAAGLCVKYAACCLCVCLQIQSEQLSEVTTRLNKTSTKLELLHGQLDKAHREIKDLKEAAQVSKSRAATCLLRLLSLYLVILIAVMQRAMWG